ncbi:MAG: ATP-binding protein [Actinomycetia bacterium]|nr:ATP-binding protein [Actinomycetes bacterium]
MTRTTNKETMDFLTSIVGEEVRSIDEDLGNGYVRLAVSEAARRQAKQDIRSVESAVIELLRNARDAGADRIYVATTTHRNKRSLVILDDGEGIIEAMWESIFEPRVTSKLETMKHDEWGVHGRGMALYSIRENTESAHVAYSKIEAGSAIVVEIDTTKLNERTDQSSWPVVMHEDEVVALRGPHNIIRTIVEFVLAHPSIEVFFGSVPEIVATLREKRTADPRHEWIAASLASAEDAGELQDEAAVLGLTISERSAYRIISGQIRPVSSVNERLNDTTAKSPESAHRPPIDLEKDVRGLKISHEDLEAFRLDLEKAFDTLGEKYYLDLIDRVEISQTGESIKARFAFDKQ